MKMRLRKLLRNWTALFMSTVFLAASLGCDSTLEVSNPNSVVEDDLSNPESAGALANGALVLLAYAASEMQSIYTTVTDEGTWIGSRDAWNFLRQGNVGDANNEFTDDAWQWITQARWLADLAVERLTAFDADGTLSDRTDLVKSYLYAATIRIMVADMFDDFVISDRRDAAPAIGEANMFTLYEDAIVSLDNALALATELGDTELQARALALRARAKHARLVWDKVNPRGTANIGDPFVDGGRTDAEALLGLVNSDWRWLFTFSAVSAITGSDGEGSDYSWQVNGRLELDILTPIANDPVTGAEDTRILATVAEFKNSDAHGGARFSPFVVVSAREMFLIAAESDLARGNSDGARTWLNNLRALDGLAANISGDVGEFLQHERQAILFLQARRLADMYRFDIKSPEWSTTSEAFNNPGSFFPIVRREIEANPFVDFGGR